MNPIGSETAWMARFTFGDIRVGEVRVVKRTAKMAKLAARNEFSGYATSVPLADVYQTRDGAIASIVPAVRLHIQRRRADLDAVEAQLRTLLESSAVISGKEGTL